MVVRGAREGTFSGFKLSTIGDKFGESLGGSQAPPSFWKVPGLPRKFPKLPRKFFGDFPGSSLTVELSSNPRVPRKFHRLSRKFLQKGRKGAGVKGAGVANCRIFRSAVPSVVVWSILLVSLSGVKKKL